MSVFKAPSRSSRLRKKQVVADHWETCEEYASVGKDMVATAEERLLKYTSKMHDDASLVVSEGVHIGSDREFLFTVDKLIRMRDIIDRITTDRYYVTLPLMVKLSQIRHRYVRHLSVYTKAVFRLINAINDYAGLKHSNKVYIARQKARKDLEEGKPEKAAVRMRLAMEKLDIPRHPMTDIKVSYEWKFAAGKGYRDLPIEYLKEDQSAVQNLVEAEPIEAERFFKGVIEVSQKVSVIRAGTVQEKEPVSEEMLKKGIENFNRRVDAVVSLMLRKSAEEAAGKVQVEDE